MSEWRLTAKVLYDMPQRSGMLSDEVSKNGITRLLQLGLATSSWCERASPEAGRVRYTLTQLGVDFCEGRVTMGPGRRIHDKARPRMTLVSTWLASLPRDVRITPYPWVQPCSSS